MITSLQNQRLKDIRRLKRSKGQLAVLEGEHLVFEALEARLNLQALLATPEFLASEAGRSLPTRTDLKPEVVAKSALASISDADSPPGVVALVDLQFEGVTNLPRRAGATFVYADGIQDPGNLGALARVAEAADASGLALAPGSVSPRHSRALRASAGSLLRLPTAVAVKPDDLHSHLRDLQPMWIALVPRGGISLFDAAWQGTPILAIGAEGPGLSPEARALASLEITIPLKPPVESLNATVAAALALFEIQRRRSPN